jgi:hypothetical protein
MMNEKWSTSPAAIEPQIFVAAPRSFAVSGVSFASLSLNESAAHSAEFRAGGSGVEGDGGDGGDGGVGGAGGVGGVAPLLVFGEPPEVPEPPGVLVAAGG